MEELAKWEAVQEQRVLTEEEIQQKTNLAITYEQVAKNEEIRWRQRSRIQWLKQGDKNTKFFDRVATSHKRYNSIESLLVDGCNTNDPSVIKETIKSFYQNLYTEPEEWRPELQLQGITTISVEEQIELEGPFEEEEILGCLKLCAMEKAPGPDDFPMSLSFYLSFWEILKENIIKAIQEFHARQITEKSFNATFVALIPRKSVLLNLKTSDQ